MTKKAYIMILMVVTYLGHGQTETNQSFVPVSPEAAALSKMINYPIDHNTGVPNINIPFYEVAVGNLKLPIVLNYHAGGFKINEKATRVGLGWSLSCDLQITRSINGMDDLKYQGGYIDNDLVKAHKTDHYIDDYPFSSTYTEYSFDNTYDLVMGIKDGMPDKFNYRLLNTSGSFYFQKNDSGSGYTIVPVPYDNIKITYQGDNTFKIVDTDGTIYYFGVAGNPAFDQYSYDNLETYKREYTGGVVTSWKCDRIVSYNGIDDITFSYSQKSSDTRVSYHDKIEYYNNSSPCFPSSGSGAGPVYGSNEPPLNTASNNDYNSSDNSVSGVPFYRISSPKYIKYFWNKTELHVPYLDGQYNVIDKVFSDNYTTNQSINTIYGLSLSEISFRGGKVIFSGTDQLSTVKVLDDKNIEVKSLSLFQNSKNTYINGVPTEGTRYLDSLHIKNGTETFQRYGLLYNSKFDYGNHLKGHDAWGYPNHKTRPVKQNTNDYLSIPETTIVQGKFHDPSFDSNCNVFTSNVEIEIGGDDNWAEHPDENYIKQGVLKQIVYPTGGIVDFDFEPNKYQEYLSSNTSTIYGQKLPQIGGGLRIRSINYLDEDSNFISQKYYRYGDLEEGTGIALFKPERDPKPNTYYFGVQSYEQEINYLEAWNGIPPCDDPSCITIIATETKTTYEPASTLDYTYPNGAPIYYTKVTEYQQDLGEQTGKTVYNFYPPDEFYPSTNDRIMVPETNIPYLKVDWPLGAQKSVETYKYNPEVGFRPTGKKSFEYTPFNLSNQVKVAAVFQKNSYKVIGGNHSVSDRELFSYHSSGAFTLIEYGLPMGKLLLTRSTEETFEDTGTLTITTDYTYGNSQYLNPTKSVTTNSKGETIKTEYKYAYDFNGIYDQMETKNMVTQLVEEINTNQTKSKEISRKKINYGFVDEGWGFYAPNTIQSSFKGEPLKTDVIFNKYDHYGNVLEVRDKANIPTSYLWGYNHLYAVAELKNMYYDNISSTFTSNNTIADPPSEASILSVLESLRNTYTSSSQRVSTYTYKRQVGVTGMIASNGDAMYYEYDPIGRLVTHTDKDGNLLNTYKYHTTDYTVNTNPFYYSYPIMRTIYGSCDANLSNNHVISGGLYYGASSASANQTAQYYMDNQAGNIPDCSGTSNDVAVVELTYGYYDYSGYYSEPVTNIYPTEMELDLIQANSIVATQKLIPHNTYNSTEAISNLVLKEGSYQLSFRMNANVKYGLGFITDFSVTTIETATTQYISSGDSFYFENGKHYKIRANNFR
ncbi:hypothetical protein CJ739_893 [Mariniflexile rhizosphaerae]|uniref:hypothetical protein n=1 Tax=unclassified Mariniflexile TaxID=2643887 RepID=UPI000CB7BA81|nr:hypothetical protein [Mariniflexile sp. TRM1-10]AXP79986.1 hypothetical protein CJ739_893 [Mariniflexile sp. TRM1-10]PLB21008.1 MAG: YD repeat protein [Flavobacteriaceae bacterium FS1-H7996/R]